MYKDIILGVVMAIISAVAIVDSNKLISANKWDVIGPDGFPKMVSYILLGLSIILIISAIRKKENTSSKMSVNILTLFTMVSIFVYVLMMPVIGFIFSTGLFLIILQLILAYDVKKSFFQSIMTTIIVTGTVFIVFEKLLNVKLP